MPQADHCDAGAPVPNDKDAGTQERDAGTTQDAGSVVDAGSMQDSGVIMMVDAGQETTTSLLRFINLTGDSVTVELDGEDAGTTLNVGDSVVSAKEYVGHVTLIKQKTGHVTLNRRERAPDGGAQTEVIDFTLDVPANEDATVYVHRNLTRVLSADTAVAPRYVVSKQTQGATFGEKVNAGLHAAGSAVAGGASLSVPGGLDYDGDCVADVGTATRTGPAISIAASYTQVCDTAALVFVRPSSVSADATPVFIQADDDATQNSVSVAWVQHEVQSPRDLQSGLPTGRRQLPIVVTRPQPRVWVLNVHPDRAPASVAINGVASPAPVATGEVAQIAPTVVAHAINTKGAGSGDRIAITVGTQTSTFDLPAPNSRLTGPCRPPYLCDFLDTDALVLAANTQHTPVVLVMKKSYDMYNAIGLEQSRLVNALPRPTVACIPGSPQDDVCFGGKSVPVNATAAPFYSAMGTRKGGQLWNPVNIVQPLPINFRSYEPPPAMGQAGATFNWSWGTSQPQFTPPENGLAIVVPGEVIDMNAPTKRGLFWLDLAPCDAVSGGGLPIVKVRLLSN